MAFKAAYPSLLRRLTLVDYPLPLKIHAYLLLGLGVGLTFAPDLVVGNPFFTTACKVLGLPAEAPSSGSGTTAIKENPKGAPTQVDSHSKRNLTITGLLALGLGLSYVGTSAFVATPQENQLMYGAIPLRFAMSFTAITSWVLQKEQRSVFSAIVCVEDMVGAIWLTYVMRDWPLWQTFRW